MYRLHYFPANASFAPHVLLEEIGAPFELVRVDKARQAHKSAAYLALNPAGRIPVLEDGDLVLFEAAAVCLHLCDRHPEAGLAPPLASPQRAQFYKWLMFLTNTIQADILAYYYPERYTTDPAGPDAVKAAADRRLTAWFGIVESALDPGPFLLGETYSAADPYLAMLVRWGRHLDDPPGRLPRLGRLCAAVLERPAVRRAIATEGLEGPFTG